jgi:molybdopterin-guanine dinucleotide biosynthesis protein A
MIPCFPGVILSGGKSSRMGEPKALLPFGPARLIDHVAARLAPQVSVLYLNSNNPDIALPGVVAFGDRFAGFPGPLGGIHAALAFVAETETLRSTHVAIVPVDAPFFPANLIARLAEHLTGPDDVALTVSDGQMHPVMGLWPLSAAPRLTVWLENPPTLKVRAFVEGLPVRTVEFPYIDTPLGPLDPFFNINTKDDLAQARKIFDVVGPA